MQKIKINTISSRVESGEERKETRDRIDEERKHQIEVHDILVLFKMSQAELGFVL